MGEFKQITQIRGAFDRRNKDSNKNYGIGGMLACFILAGAKGAVHFTASLPAYLEHNRREMLTSINEYSFKPYGFDVGYHSPIPQYNGQEPHGPCEYLDGAVCYCDGSALRADEFLPRFISGGSEVVWKMLEEEYANRFAEGEK